VARNTANLTSIDALRELKGALLQFQTDVASALVALELESRRPLEWIDNDRSRYWPAQMRQASDDLNSARINLERCELAIRPDDRRSCYDEHKAFENAKRRLRLTEHKVQVVRQWKMKIRKEVEEFMVHVSKLRWYMESDFLRSIAQLERMAEALDRYVQMSAAPTDAPSSASPAATEAKGEPHANL
jgi:hypothetical protein